MMDKYKAKDLDKKVLIQTADDAFKNYMEKYEKSAEIVDPGIEPIGMNALVSATLMSIDEAGYYLTSQNFNMKALKEVSDEISVVQTVISVGPSCQQLQPGDKIKINISDFERVKNPNSIKSEEVIELPLEIIDGRTYMMIHERNARFIYKRE